jgi:hypothetical protein
MLFLSARFAISNLLQNSTFPPASNVMHSTRNLIEIHVLKTYPVAFNHNEQNRPDASLRIVSLSETPRGVFKAII